MEVALAQKTQVVAPVPSLDRHSQSEVLQAKLKESQQRILQLSAQIKALEEEAGTYRLRAGQLERQLEEAKCKKCERNDAGRSSSMLASVTATAEVKFRDKINALEKVGALATSLAVEINET